LYVQIVEALSTSSTKSLRALKTGKDERGRDYALPSEVCEINPASPVGQATRRISKTRSHSMPALHRKGKTMMKARRTRRKGKLAITSPSLAKIRGPSRNNPEIPILCTLASAHEKGMETKLVLRKIRRKFYPELSKVDVEAVYPSGKKVFETVVKFAKKHLVEKGEIYPVGSNGLQIGIWKPTPKGCERAFLEGERWHPEFGEYNALMPA
jgi:hypothetical protein